MTALNLPPARYIASSQALWDLVNELSYEPLLAIDTESNSLYAYHEQVCLIQVSSQSADYIIDPLVLAPHDVQPFGDLLSNPAIEKIFHACEYDLMCLKRDFGFTVTNLFDTMIAARICGYKQVGLNNLLAQHLDIALDKSHQRDNWGERPLPAESLRYAQMDTHFLPALRDLLASELEEQGHLIEAEESFAEMCIATPAHDGRTFDPEGYWKIGIPNRLNTLEMGVLRELYLRREAMAQEMNLPPFRVLSNQALLEIARRQPHTSSELNRTPHVSGSMVRRYGRQLLKAIQDGRSAHLPPAPVFQPPPVEVNDRYTVLHTWRKNRAIQRGVESDVIISRQTLKDLAEKAPTTLDDLRTIEGLGPWRLEMYGAEILQVLSDFESQRHP